MKIKIFLLIIFFIITNCSFRNVEISNDKKSVTIYKNFLFKKEKVIQLNFLSPLKDDKNFINSVYTYLKYFNIYLNKKNEITLNIDDSDNEYIIFYKIGLKYFEDINVPLIKYGLIQLIWMKICDNEYNKSRSKKNDYYNYILIKDFELFIKNQNKITSDILYSYIVKYLLENIYFVSIQEILERPYRYLSTSDLNTIFYQIVIAPEITLFVKYLINEFGVNKVLNFSFNKYSKENWKKYFDHEINEIEENFSKKIEKLELNNYFDSDEKIKEFDSLLKVYNTTTKNTLFKK